MAFLDLARQSVMPAAPETVERIAALSGMPRAGLLRAAILPAGKAAMSTGDSCSTSGFSIVGGSPSAPPACWKIAKWRPEAMDNASDGCTGCSPLSGPARAMASP